MSKSTDAFHKRAKPKPLSEQERAQFPREAVLESDLAIAQAALARRAPRKQPKRYSKPVLMKAAEAAYKTFVKEAGYELDARVPEWKGQKPIHQERWCAIARAVLESADG